MGPRDVLVSVEDPTKWPYTSLFKTRSGHLVGKIVTYSAEANKYPLITKHYTDL